MGQSDKSCSLLIPFNDDTSPSHPIWYSIRYCTNFGAQAQAKLSLSRLVVIGPVNLLKQSNSENRWFLCYLLPIACHTYLESLCCNDQFEISRNNFSPSYDASEFCWQIAPNFGWKAKIILRKPWSSNSRFAFPNYFYWFWVFQK